MTEEPTEQVKAPFEGIDSDRVLSIVASRLGSAETRSLWRRLESEFKESGVAGVDSYLRSMFADMTQGAREEIERFSTEREEED